MAQGDNNTLRAMPWGKILGTLGSALIGALVAVAGLAWEASKARTAEKLETSTWRGDITHQLNLIDIKLLGQVGQMSTMTQQELERHNRLQDLLVELQKRLVERDNSLHDRLKQLEDHLRPFRGTYPPPP